MLSPDQLAAEEDPDRHFNRYAYAYNNPASLVDPDGRIPVETVWDIANIAYDLGKAGVGYVTGNPALVSEGLADAALDTAAALTPYAPAGASKVARIVGDVGDSAGKGVAKGTAGGTRAGKSFTPKGKAEIDAANAERHGGVNVCVNCGVQVVPGQRSQRGVTPPGNERHRDHQIPKSKGGDGDPSNGQILCRTCNLDKSDKL
jgi:hypothetical protein